MQLAEPGVDLVAGDPLVAGQLARRWADARPRLALVLAHTDTSSIPGLSVAGAGPDLLPYTPPADAETIVLGAPACLGQLPSHPAGVPGPAGITRAALLAAEIPCTVYCLGLPFPPRTLHLVVSHEPGGRIDLGCGARDASRLLAAGRSSGRVLAAGTRHLVLGESVPGGTTTALSLLMALGVQALGRVSGSVPDGAHSLKERVVRSAFQQAERAGAPPSKDPLDWVVCLGDPMQPFVAGLALGALSCGADVLLAGGTQMVAVAALMEAVAPQCLSGHLAIATTRWVAHDPASDLAGLADDACPGVPVLAARLNFGRSPHQSLRAYERFYVKEGAGAGGACTAALLTRRVTLDGLHAAVDQVYDSLVAAGPPS